MNYQKIISDLEHHAKEAAEFLAGFTEADEMESEKAAHKAMVCAVHALKKLERENARLRSALNDLHSIADALYGCGHSEDQDAYELWTRKNRRLLLNDTPTEPPSGDARREG